MSPRQTRRAAKLEDTLSETISKPSMVDTPTEKRKKTRRNAKSEAINSTLSETISSKALAITPPTQTKKRTRRQPTKASSLESDVEQSPETNKSKRRTVQETPSKPTRSRKKVLLDNTTMDDGSIVAPTTKPRRTRKNKENETSTDPSLLMDITTVDSSPANVNKSRGTRARKKPAKKIESNNSYDETTFDKKSDASSAKNVTIIDNFVDSTINDSAIPMSSEDNEVLQVSNRISRLKSAAASSSSPASRNRSSRNVKSRLEDFTPESSPITVNLTPHRTTKTPRKSPMNLNSPKSHADAPLRLSKTPRKLPVVVESPVPSEMSVTSSTHTTPDKTTKIRSPESSGSRKKSHESPRSPAKSKKSPGRNSVKSVGVRKFSKSPKIVLRSPKAKSPKAVRVSVSRAKRISPVKRSIKSPRNRNEKSSSSPGGKSPNSARRSNSSMERKKTELPTSPTDLGTKSGRISGSPGALMSLHLARVDSPSSSGESKISTPTSHPKLSRIKSPSVIIDITTESRVEPVENVTRSSLRRSRTDDASKITPLQTPSVEKRSSQGGESPHRAKSTGKKRSAITDSGTPLRPVDSPVSSSNDKPLGRKSIIISSSNTPIDNGRPKNSIGGTKPILSSSTPRERIRRSLNLSPSSSMPLEIVNSPMNGEIPAGSSTMIWEGRSKRRSLLIDDESNPLISDDESTSSSPRGVVSRLDGTFEVDDDKNATIIAENEEDGKTGDGTYELAEPTTPHLRRKTTKRSLADMDPSIEERVAKRTCRVRFASPEPDEDENKTVGNVVGRSRSATPGHQVGMKRGGINGSGIVRPQGGKDGAVNDNSRRRSNSMSNVSLLGTPVANKRRSNSVSDVSARSASRRAQITSVNRLSKPRPSIPSAKKPEVKTPVARKAPNFAQIHQKKFAQMESLVDAKKRVEKRHLAMSTKIPKPATKVDIKLPTKPATSSQPIAPVVAVNGSYNRYGFKLRKEDATKLVAQKQPTFASRKKQADNRLLLKGVRTNRRFDLIMKARNVNI